jgi:hypothetical protein
MPAADSLDGTKKQFLIPARCLSLAEEDHLRPKFNRPAGMK